MCNKRNFKKDVEGIGSSAINEMMVAYVNIKDVDRKGVAEAVEIVLGAMTSAKDEANICFDRGPRSFADSKEYSKARRAFFKALFAKIANDFNQNLEEALKKFNAALPESVKEAQKVAAN